ncbi:MAG: glycoside hydrolase family 99-like domain-containing protein [Bacteroidaceae bacterium]|nr:glycoside hydrolase family 99-like domain-containing protein [Bacteroidaceae bacterium]
MKARVIAYYLPQYHPFPENDEWWGKGFTEWTNVARARKLFPGHYQPHIPADLGFYDLRVPEVREQQAALAREAGIEAFCYYEYWFGNGKHLMDRPFNEVVESGKPDFPFCLCWANQSWYKKFWDPNKKGHDRLLVEQKYPGEDDYIAHFNALLPAFKDQRYLRVNGKLFYIVYQPFDSKEIINFLKLWRRLAQVNGMNDFYFVASDFNSERREEILAMGFDATHNIDHLNIYHCSNVFVKGLRTIGRNYLGIPMIYKYKDAMRYMLNDDCRRNDVIPVILPNWDHTPRSKARGLVMTDSKPKYFKQLAKQALELVKDKPEEERIIILKSWNEWGEGNYMEPDMEYGHGYINALAEAIREFEPSK